MLSQTRLANVISSNEPLTKMPTNQIIKREAPKLVKPKSIDQS